VEGSVTRVLLDGCRVLDLTDERGLLCGQLLADLGATVAHVEPPGGSPARADECLWKAHTRNQQSVLLDLTDASDHAEFVDLAKQCDIFVESGATPSMDELGLGFASLIEENPTLVYVSISPFGCFGPKHDYQATDLVVQAAAGNMAITGFVDRPPLRPVGVTAWAHAGAAAAGAALIALRLARRAGKPSHVDVSAQEATSLAAGFTLLNKALGNAPTRRAASDPGMATGIVACADGFVNNTIGTVGPLQHFLARQVNWMVREGVLDGDLAAALSGGEPSRDAVARLGGIIRTMFASRTKQELLDAARQNGFVLAPINTTEEVVRSEQFQARNVWWRDGSLVMPGPFASFHPTPLSFRRPSPAIGEHDEPIFAPALWRETTAGGSKGRPLDDVNVLDFGWIMAGPYATRMMADYGATVVKVESAKRIDLLRLLPPYYDFASSPENSASFAAVNAGKQSLDLDLSQPAAREIILDLVDWADVVCESFAPGAMRRLQLDYESLRARKPNLIMVSSSLFGQTGPYASMGGYGSQGSALAGLTLPTGYADRPPIGPFGPFTDFVAPRFQLVAILAALEHRDRTGRGQYVDLAQAETGLQAMAAAIARSSRDGVPLDREANADAAMRPHGVYPAKGDDAWVAIAVRNASDWSALCDLIGRSDLDGKPVGDGIDDVIGTWTSSHAAPECERLLQTANVPAHHVVNTTTAFSDPHLAARGMFVTTVHSGHEALVTSTGYHFSSAPASVGRVPAIGADTVSVLRDHLGYSSNRIDALMSSGVIAAHSASAEA
jgi:crotonobetainyl-CoA:carnitine CoA-transferase CaiB-like acyl-CoA transferase